MPMAAVLAVLVASLLGSVHCAAMCGGFGCLAAAQGPRAHAAYHAGRWIGYVLLGALAGAFGALLDQSGVWAGVGRIAAPAAGFVAMSWGVLALWRERRPALPATSPRGGRIAAVLRGARGWSPVARGGLLGLVTALLPCGWLWLFVATAAGTGTAWGGALAMTAFWAGSVPLLGAASLAGGRLAARLGTWRPRLAAVLLLVVGGLTVAGRLRPIMLHGAHVGATHRMDAGHPAGGEAPHHE